MAKNLENKKEKVEEIKAKIQQAKSVVIVSYNGISVAEDTELRRAFRKENVEYKVLKNTLVRRAFNDLGVTSFDEDLNGTTSICFGEDEVSAAKIVEEFSKKFADRLSAKSAYVDGAYVDKAGVKNLASMPSKPELIAKMLGSMQAPITNFAGVLSGIIRKVVIALNAVSEKKANA